MIFLDLAVLKKVYCIVFGSWCAVDVSIDLCKIYAYLITQVVQHANLEYAEVGVVLNLLLATHL